MSTNWVFRSFDKLFDPYTSVKNKHGLEASNRALDSHSILLKDIASILGLFAWAISSIPLAHYRSLQMQYINLSKLPRGNLKTKVILNSGSRSDLGWWVNNLAQINGRLFSARAPDVIIFSDASRSGWGAFRDGVGAGGPWISSENELNINALELKAAFNALLCFAPEASGLFI